MSKFSLPMAAENLHRKEEPSPFREFDEYAHEESTKSASHRTAETEKAESEVSHSPWRECDANDSDYVWHRKCGTNASKRYCDGESNEAAGAEAIDHRPDDPPRAAENQDVLVAIYCSDTTAYKDKCTLGESGHWSLHQ